MVVDRHGETTERWLPGFTPAGRRRLYEETDDGLEPLALWLNSNGLPRPAKAWEKTFDRANGRVEAAGLENLWCTPHMLRHSAALRWFAFAYGRYRRTYAHLSDAEMADFRPEFGDVWHFVQTMLGHSSPETTKNYYLRPFQALSVDMLLAEASDTEVSELGDILAVLPSVLSDPVIPR